MLADGIGCLRCTQNYCDTTMRLFIILLFALFFTQACRTIEADKGSDLARDLTASQSGIADRDFEPSVRPGMGLQVAVMVSGNKEIDEQSVRVNREGRIALPLIGGLEVEGRSLAELRSLLQKRYAKYFVEPEVMVGFGDDDQDASPWGYVTILGRVENPGRVPVPANRDLTVSAAVQQAGGLASSAKSSDIRVTRKNGENDPERFEVDLRAFANGDVDEDRNLQPGDIVHVPERIW